MDKAQIYKVALYDEKARFTNEMFGSYGIPEMPGERLAEMLQIISDPSAIPALGGVRQFIIGQVDQNLPPHLIFKQETELLLNYLGNASGNDGAYISSVMKMDDDKWKNFYEQIIKPEDIATLSTNYANYKLMTKMYTSPPAVEMPKHAYSGVITAYSDLNGLPINEDTKYQIGLAAVNSVNTNSYYGHHSLTSEKSEATVYVVDNMQHAYAVFNGLDKNSRIDFPLKNDADLKQGVIHLRGRDDTGFKHEAVIVSREYLKDNLGQSLDFLKTYEAKAKDVMLPSASGTKNLDDFLTEMQKDSPLKINSFSNYNEGRLEAPLAERSGSAKPKSL